MTTNPMTNQEWESIRRKEAHLQREGANFLFGLLSLLGTSTMHVRIDDTKDDQEVV